MKFAWEVPLAHLEEFSPYQDYCYCFSHLLRDDRDGSYKKWVRSEKKTGKTVLLDNGANEGFLSDKKILFELIGDIGADIVVAPDKPSNFNETIELVSDFYSSFPKTLSCKVLVPFQGVREQIEGILRVIRVGDILGFPIGRVASVNREMMLTGNYLIDSEYMRFSIMKDVYDKYSTYLRQRGIKGHLLGLKTPYMLKTYKFYEDFLVSLDTTFISILAKESIKLDDDKDYCFPWGSIIPDFDFNWELSEEERSIAKYNICVTKEMSEKGSFRYDSSRYKKNIEQRVRNRGKLRIPYIRTLETREKNSRGNKGKTRSEETKRRI